MKGLGRRMFLNPLSCRSIACLQHLRLHQAAEFSAIQKGEHATISLTATT